MSTSSSPTPPNPPAARRSAIGALLCGLLLVVSAGCGTIGAFVDIKEELEQEGFDNVGIEVTDLSGADALQVTADPPGGLGVEAAQNRAAEITWKTFSRRFDRLEVVLSGTSRTYERAELEEQFGARPAGLDDKELGDEIRNIGIGVLIALVVGGLLCVGLVVLVVILVLRSSRKKKQAAQQQWQGQTGPGQPPWSGGPGVGPGVAGGPPPQPPQPPAQSPPGWS